MNASPLPLRSPPAPVLLPDGDAPLSWRLAPGVRLLWRGDGSFQLEHLDGGVVVAGLDREVAAGLARPPRDDLPAVPTPTPTAAPADLAALHRLAELGYLRAAVPPPRLRLARPPDPSATPGSASPSPDLPTDPEVDVDPPDGASGGVDAVHDLPPDPDDPRERRAVLRATRVDVTGLTAVSAHVGALLAAAGVGSVRFTSTGVVRRRHLLPGGLSVADEGRRFAAAAADVVARAAPRVDVAPPAEAEPDLVVLCLDGPVEPELRDLLHRTRRAHLVVHLDAEQGEIGPLVLPGLSACLRCADLYRLDHDPAWTLLAVQLLARAGTGPVPEAGFAARIGALTASLALRWLTGDPLAGGTLDGSWQLRPDEVTPRHRRRRAHPECSCRAVDPTEPAS